MSSTDHLREAIDLAETSCLQLAEFPWYHDVVPQRLERWRELLNNTSTERGLRRVKRLLLLLEELAAQGKPTVVVRLVLDDGSWIEVPVGFSDEHLGALLDVLDDKP